MDHSRRRSPRPRLRNRYCAVAVAAAAAVLAAPAGALAANPPTILTAGINAADELYATWAVAPGTTFDFVTFATVPDADPSLPSFFAQGNFAGFCDVASADALCTATSYNSGYPITRDRRYYAKVTAKVGPGDYVTSAVWVVDDAKPQIAGSAPVSSVPPTNTPVAGHPLGAPAPPPAVAPPPVAPPPPPPPAPAATGSIKILSLPSTIGALLARGVRLRVTCTGSCTASSRMRLGLPSIGSKSLTLPGGGTRTLTIKPSVAGRNRLRGRSSARLKLTANLGVGGKGKSYTKNFTVRRR